MEIRHTFTNHECLRYHMIPLLIAIFLQINSTYAIAPATNLTATDHTEIQEFSFNKKAPVTKKTSAQSLEEDLTNKAPDEEKIYLNFNDASLASVLNYLVERKNLDVIPHKDLANIKVSLLSREPITLTEAWETMLILMESNNFTIVNVNGINRVIPLATNTQNPLPCYSSARGVEPENLPDTNAICRYIYFCKNIKLAAAQAILTPLLNDRAIQTNNPLQAFVLTDNCNNIKAAMRIVKELDIGGMRQAIKILNLKHFDSDTLAKLFNEQIIQAPQQDGKIRIISEENKREMSYFAKDTKILSDPSRNRLIFLGIEESIDKIIHFINTYLDIPLEKADSRIHIKELKYYTAANMKTLLDTMITPPKGQGQPIPGEYFTDVIISAEQASTGTEMGRGAGNRLIISCNTDDWRRLSDFIDRLDKPQPQVALEMLIVDVETSDNKALGAQLRAPDGLFGGSIGAQSFPLPTNNPAVTVQNIVNSLAVEANSSILSFGNASSGEIWGIIRAIYSIKHSNIISQPYLIVNNNTKGVEELSVSRQIPGALQTTNTGVPVRNNDNVQANISVNITPHINSSGIIKLNIAVTVNEFSGNSSTSPDMNQRSITAQATMAAGEVLVLGGLTSSSHSTSQWAVPFLSKLPIIGNLFKNKSQQTNKNNLYVFCRPTVIKPFTGLGSDEYTQLKLDYAKYQILGYDSTTLSTDPIQRYFFAPGRYDKKQKEFDLKNNRMPIIDDFSERRNMPNEVEMSKDPYYHRIPEAESINYDPEEGFASMPHIDPNEYITPGLMDELNADSFWDSFEEENAQKPMLGQRPSSLQSF